MKHLVVVVSISAIALLNLPGLSAQESSGHFVELEDGRKISGKEVRYVNPPFKRPYLLVDSESRFQLSIVKSYQNEKGFFLKGSLPPYGEIGFAKRVLKGEVSVYEKTTVTYMTGPYAYGGVYRSDYYTKGNSGLKKVNLRELAIDLSDNAASMKHLKKAKNTGVIQNIFYGLGAACIVYGIASFANQDHSQVDNRPNFPPALIAAPICLLIPLPLNVTKKDHLNNAIILYNESH